MKVRKVTMMPKLSIGAKLAIEALLFVGALASWSHGAGSNAWKVIGPGGGGTMIAPTISPHDSRLVVEHCDMTGGYVTRDNGQSWRMFNLRGGINVLAFDPAVPSVIYAGNAALWRSSDSAAPGKWFFPVPPATPSSINSATTPTIASLRTIPPIPVAKSPPSPSLPKIAAKSGQESHEHLYLSFAQKGQSSVIVFSAGWRHLLESPRHAPRASPAAHGARLRPKFSLDRRVRLLSLAHRPRWRRSPNWASSHLPFAQPARRSPATRSGSTQPARTERSISPRIQALNWKPVTPQLQQTSGRFRSHRRQRTASGVCLCRIQGPSTRRGQ